MSAAHVLVFFIAFGIGAVNVFLWETTTSRRARADPAATTPPGTPERAVVLGRSAVLEGHEPPTTEHSYSRKHRPEDVGARPAGTVESVEAITGVGVNAHSYSRKRRPQDLNSACE